MLTLKIKNTIEFKIKNIFIEMDFTRRKWRKKLNEIFVRKNYNPAKQSLNKYIESSKNYQRYQLDLFTLCDYISRYKNSVELSWPFSKFTSSGLAKDKSATTIIKEF